MSIDKDCIKRSVEMYYIYSQNIAIRNLKLLKFPTHYK